MIDRFAILQAYYLFGSHYHGGQGTKEYAYMGRVLRCGLGGKLPSKLQDLDDESRPIYNQLVRKYEKARRAQERTRINGGKGHARSV